MDGSQTTHTIRRNYPVAGRFRYFFEHLGEFFRQYFFAMDHDELPFNRAERPWVCRAAKNVDNTIAFRSTRHLDMRGEPHFLNSAFPTLDKDAVAPAEIMFGQDSCTHPFKTAAVINVSAMSLEPYQNPQ